MRALQSPILWLLVVGIAVVAVAVITVMRGRDRSVRGFQDVVKNPGYLDRIGAAQQEVASAAQAAQSWNDEKVAAAARAFVLEATSSRDDWDEYRILRGLGERTHPAVLELLREPGLYARLVKPTGTNLLAESPLNRACDLLGDAPPPEAVEALAPFLNDPSKEIRKDAALAIARTGAPAISAYVRQAFSDSDEYVRSYALMGLQFALKRAALADNVSREIFPDVLALLREGKNADKAADILFRVDSERAKEFFLSEEVFTADSPILHEALQTLADAAVPVPRERLLDLIGSTEAKDLAYPRTYALGEALRLLGQQQRDEDRDSLRIRMTHDEEIIAQGAASGLLCSYGLEGFQQRIWDTETQSGYEALSERQRFYSAVFMCNAEINNGGLAQYFFNSSGDHWPDALAGFEAMGFRERLSVLKEAVALFGGNGPSTDRSARQAQLSKLYKRNDAIFEELESRYYESAEVIEVFAARFVLAHPDSFR